MMDIHQVICYIAVISMLFVSSASVAKDRLVLVLAVFRHGDRSPLNTFPNDKHRSYWYRGLGQLTQEGIRQEYNLGKFFKMRYGDGQFLSSRYIHSEIRVTSSDFDRTLMSAYSVLSGLYPPKGTKQQWNPDLNWQPIPVHTKPRNEDFVLSVAPCPRYHELDKEYSGESTMDKFVTTHQDLVEQIMNISGLSKDSWSSIVDILYCQYVHNLSLPEWESVLPFNMVISLRDKFASYILLTQETAKLKGGPLLKEIIENMKRNLNTNSNRKVYLYSGHDSTLIALMRVLNVFDGRHPSYSACIIVELWKSGKDETPYVRVIFKNGTNNHMNTLRVPGCFEDCPFNDFVSILANSIPKDIEEDCKNENGSGVLGSSVDNNIIGVFVLMGIVTFIVIVLVIRNVHICRIGRVLPVYHTVPTEDGYPLKCIQEHDHVEK